MAIDRGFLLLKAAAAVAAVWMVAWLVMKVAGVYEVTPAKIEDFLEERSISEIDDPDERREWIDKVAHMVNRLEFEDRREFRTREELRRRGPEGELERGFWEDLNGEERLYFMDLTMGTAFKQMMKAFNEMEAEERREFVARARRDMGEREGDREQMARVEEEDAEMYDKIVNEGLESYYRDASADTKRDLAPLMEEIQEQMQRPRHHREKGRMRVQTADGEE